MVKNSYWTVYWKHGTVFRRSFLWAHVGNCSFSTVHKYLWVCSAQVHLKNGVSTHSEVRHKNVILGPPQGEHECEQFFFVFSYINILDETIY
jgi:hypothetical protein